MIYTYLGKGCRHYVLVLSDVRVVGQMLQQLLGEVGHEGCNAPEPGVQAPDKGTHVTNGITSCR